MLQGCTRMILRRLVVLGAHMHHTLRQPQCIMAPPKDKLLALLPCLQHGSKRSNSRPQWHTGCCPLTAHPAESQQMGCAHACSGKGAAEIAEGAGFRQRLQQDLLLDALRRPSLLPQDARDRKHVGGVRVCASPHTHMLVSLTRMRPRHAAPNQHWVSSNRCSKYWNTDVR